MNPQIDGKWSWSCLGSTGAQDLSPKGSGHPKMTPKALQNDSKSSKFNINPPKMLAKREPENRVQGSGFKVQGSVFRVQGSGFRVQGSGFRVQGSSFQPKRGRRQWA